jgi:uncharacterized protein YqjF (DUF2071 family)
MINLKNHPFAVQAFFEKSLVLTYAIPKALLENRIPECLTLDTYEDKWAFMAVALVNTKDLRPKGFPKFMGKDFILVGMRIFVNYTNVKGKRLRGLYILQSETNKKLMSYFGNLFTHYNYHTTDITYEHNQDSVSFQSQQSKFLVKVSTQEEAVPLPPASPFKDWKEARRFAGPLPFTFTYNKNTKEVLMIEGVRTQWIPKPVAVLQANVGFITQQHFETCVLANAFILENIPYYWKKGKIEKWNP